VQDAGMGVNQSGCSLCTAGREACLQGNGLVQLLLTHFLPTLPQRIGSINARLHLHLHCFLTCTNPCQQPPRASCLAMHGHQRWRLTCPATVGEARAPSECQRSVHACWPLSWATFTVADTRMLEGLAAA
jgi:hypothetical protein